jgi:hypothetical protein
MILKNKWKVKNFYLDTENILPNRKVIVLCCIALFKNIFLSNMKISYVSSHLIHSFNLQIFVLNTT